jgi:hypothetical protein
MGREGRVGRGGMGNLAPYFFFRKVGAYAYFLYVSHVFF